MTPPFFEPMHSLKGGADIPLSKGLLAREKSDQSSYISRSFDIRPRVSITMKSHIFEDLLPSKDFP